MLKTPFDIVVVFAIISLVVVTVGFGVTSVGELGANLGGQEEFFSDVNNSIYQTTGLKGTADEASDVIDPSDQPVTAEATEEGIITQGLQSLRSIAGTYKAVENIGMQSTGIFGIDPVYVAVVASVIIIMMFVLIYTWARGR